MRVVAAAAVALIGTLIDASAGHAARAAAVDAEPREPAMPGAVCLDPAGPVALGSAQWNGWGRGVENTRYQPEPAIRAADVSRLALKWAFGFPAGPVSGQPSIVDGRVFVASAGGRVYALDAKSGCTYWTYAAQSAVRTAVSVAELAAPRKLFKKTVSKHKMTDAHLDVQKVPSAAFFGDDSGAVYALDTETGALLWKTQIDAHPLARIQASPAVYQKRLYVAVGSGEAEAARDASYACCTFRGSVAALDLESGRILWKSYLVRDEPGPVPAAAAGAPRFGPAGVPVVAAPTIDSARGLVYVSTGDSYNPAEQPLADAVVALDLADGKVRWAKQLSGSDGAAAAIDSSPILRTLASGQQALLAGQMSGTVYSLDPERGGEILWQIKVPATAQAPGGIVWGAAADHRMLYAALAGQGAAPADTSGSLTAIDIKTGAKRWQTAAPTPACGWTGVPRCSHAQAQAVTVIPGAAFSGSMDGHLRAYSTIDGKILWDYDTAKDFTTVNGVKASGGSLDEGGPTIVNGIVYVNSGGGRGGRSGNVLLAFSVAGK
jgi:polyvinyl alcohol dehydrogenase (cytochrome)